MDIIISNTSDKPIYEQIVLQIKEMIINGKLAEAELMPSIRNLAKELQISVITTKRAYDELEKDGVPGYHTGERHLRGRSKQGAAARIQAAPGRRKSCWKPPRRGSLSASPWKRCRRC